MAGAPSPHPVIILCEYRDLKSGKCIGNFKNAGTSVAITPDGRRALSGAGKTPKFEDWGLEIRVWDLRHNWFQKGAKSICTFKGHLGYITSVAILPNSEHAISASSDHTLRLWDLKSGKQVLTFTGHTETVTGVAVQLRMESMPFPFPMTILCVSGY